MGISGTFGNSADDCVTVALNAVSNMDDSEGGGLSSGTTSWATFGWPFTSPEEWFHWAV